MSSKFDPPQLALPPLTTRKADFRTDASSLTARY